LLNASKLATGLCLSAPTVTRYIDLLVDLLLVRRLPPVHATVAKRLVKAPKTYIRDSGLLHALLGLGGIDDLAGHPVVGASWEGFVVEALLNNAPDGTESGFYRTSAGAEMDLVLDLPANQGRWCVAIKRSLAVAPTKGFHHARADLAPDRCFIVHAGDAAHPVTDGVDAIGVLALAEKLRGLV
jgi:predicted AAA+ superfamily ATPase